MQFYLATMVEKRQRSEARDCIASRFATNLTSAAYDYEKMQGLALLLNQSRRNSQLQVVAYM
jgi:hypothetical protein